MSDARSIGCLFMPESIGFLDFAGQVFLHPPAADGFYPFGMKTERVGEWIEKARKHRGWTQTQLGDEVGVSKANISHWETGKHEPSFGQLLSIRDKTGYALRDVGPAAEWPFPKVPRELITSLPPEQREALQAGIAGILVALAPMVEPQKPQANRK